MQQAPVRCALIALPLCLAACQHPLAPAPTRAPAQPMPPTAAHPKYDRYIALGEIRSRDQIVVILSGPNGLVYTVKSKDGAILATRLSEAELLARFPKLGDAIAEGFRASSRPARPGRLIPTDVRATTSLLPTDIRHQVTFCTEPAPQKP